jgi:TonB family protein
MKPYLLVPIIMFGVASSALSQDKGHCPSPADIPKAARAKSTPTPVQTPPVSDPKYAGTVSLRLVISDKGYVCSVQLVRGFDKTAEAKAIQAARTWRFNPSHLKKTGQPVAVEMMVDIAFRRNENGEVILAQPSQRAK